MDSPSASPKSASSALLELLAEPRMVRVAVSSYNTPDDLMTPPRAKALWGARCGKSARRVLTGGTSPRGNAGSVRSPVRKRRLRQGSAKATASRLVSTGHSISHELLLRAVRKHTDCAWVLLYIERWLKAPVQLEDGTLEPRTKGSPQGSVVSPLLANLFLHWTFDRWMAKHHPGTPFERFADDILCHCDTEQQARNLKEELEKRFADCGLELHPGKTRIVYCKDDDRRGRYPHEKFDYLGYTFRARRSKNRFGKFFVNFSPGVSDAATKAIREEIRDWQLRCRVDRWIDDLARMFNPIIRGWINYYGRYYKSALYPTLRHLDRRLAHWAMAKYKRLRRHRRRAGHWISEVVSRDPKLFAHWPLLHRAPTRAVRAG